MKVAIITPGGIANFGERAIMLGTIYELREKYPQAEIVIFGYNDLATEDPSLHAELVAQGVDFWPQLIPPKANKLKKLFVALGIAIAPKATLPSKTYAFLKEAKVYSKGQESFTQDYGLVHFVDSFLEQVLVSRITRDIILLGHSIGPVNKYRALSSWILGRFSKVYARDSRSYKLLLELGYPEERIALRDDLAYTAVKKLQLDPVTPNSHYLVIPNAAICRTPAQAQQYLKNLSGIITKLLDDKKKVLIGSSVTSQDWNNDYAFCEELKRLHPAIHLKYYRELKELLEDIKASEKVISSRLHPLIMANGMGVRVMALSRSHKVIGLLGDRDLSEKRVDPFGEANQAIAALA